MFFKCKFGNKFKPIILSIFEYIDFLMKLKENKLSIQTIVYFGYC